MNKKFLFIAGIGRSGTTALVDTLSTHPKIVLGMERFKRLNNPARAQRWRPEHFSKESFFDFSNSLTNMTPELPQMAVYYARMENKFDNCEYIGDKAGIEIGKILLENFPGAKILHIVRDPRDVASSWDRRARNPKSRWPVENDARKSVEYWNASNLACSQLMREAPDSVISVSYERYFGDTDEEESRRVLSFLALESEESYAEGLRASRSKFRDVISTKNRHLDEDVTAYIKSTADMSVRDALFPDWRSGPKTPDTISI